MLPQPFRDRCERQLGEESVRLFEALEGESPTSLRFNPYTVAARPEGRGVPWSRYGFYLDERPQFTLDPLFHGGAYYVQEPSSMFIEHIFRQVEGGDPAPLRLLDLCAAPGGKTTLLASLAGLDSTVVANEVNRSRALVLADNVRRWGLGNVTVTNDDPSHYAGFRDWFDFVLVDAPCSGEGMFRKDPAARTEWSESAVMLCASRQRHILESIWPSLKPGGILVYSTCTFNTDENEANVRWLASEFDCEGVEIPIDPEWGIVTGSEGGIPTFRFYPHRLSGEGFFAAVLRKGDGRTRPQTPRARKSPLVPLPRRSALELGEWVAQPEYMRFGAVGEQLYGYYAHSFEDVLALAGSLNVVTSGVQMGQLYGHTLRPDHSLALFHDLVRCPDETSMGALQAALSAAGLSTDPKVELPQSTDVVQAIEHVDSRQPVSRKDRAWVPEAELSLDVAREYLRKQTLDPVLFAEGLNLVCYEGLPIGWAKRVGNRVNNMYPKELRILNL